MQITDAVSGIDLAPLTEKALQGISNGQHLFIVNWAKYDITVTAEVWKILNKFLKEDREVRGGGSELASMEKADASDGVKRLQNASCRNIEFKEWCWRIVRYGGLSQQPHLSILVDQELMKLVSKRMMDE